jgi:hypothetical protein
MANVVSFTQKSPLKVNSFLRLDRTRCCNTIFIDICTVSQDIIIDINAGSGYRAGKTFVKESEMIIINIIIRINHLQKPITADYL